MNKKLSMLFLTFLLSVTLSVAVSANAEPDVNYEYGSQSIEMIETSKGHILITQAQLDDDTWDENYTILRYDANGKQYAKLALGVGKSYFTTYNGKAYIVFLNYNDNAIQIYSEAFELLKTLPVDSSNIQNELEFKSIQGEFIYFLLFDKDLVFAVSLKDLAITTTAPRKVESAYVHYEDNGLTLATYDQYEKVIVRHTVAGNFDKNAVYSHTVVANDHVYVASATNEVNVLKMDFDGNIVASTPVAIPANLLVDAPYLTAIEMDDKILFYENTYDDTKKVLAFIYNMNTAQVEHVTSKPGGVTYKYYDNGKLREFTFDENAEITFYDTSFNKLVALQNVKQGASLLYPGGNYLIVNKQTSTAFTSVLYDFTTGKPIRTLFTSDNLYNPIGVKEALLFDSNTTIYYVVQQDQDDMVAFDAKGYFTQVASKGSINEIKPTPLYPVVPATKTWTAKLTQEVDPASVTNQTVRVTNQNGEQMDVKVAVEGKNIIISAPNGKYTSGNYTLTLENIKSVSGKTLKKPGTKQFSVQ